MKRTLSKILSNVMAWLIVSGLASNIAIANTSKTNLETTASSHSTTESIEKHSNSSTQSVLKSTTDNEITIQLDNQLEQTSTIQNIPIASQTKSAAQQAGLFRIYRSNLLKKTYQHVIYPESAIDRNQQGDVILKLTISRDGKIKGVDYNKRADFSSLNKAAARAVKNSTPYPPAPKSLHGESFEVVMPIKFRLAG